MSAELVIALGSFSAMIVTWAFLPSSSRQSAEEPEKEERAADSVPARD